MEINKNQLFAFTELDGTVRKCGCLEVRYSNKQNSFYVFSNQDENTKLYSNTIIDKPLTKKKAITKQTDISKMIEIHPIKTMSTDKAYAVEDGSNGLVGKGCKVYYKYYAKSICVVESNKIYVPVWA